MKGMLNSLELKIKILRKLDIFYLILVVFLASFPHAAEAKLLAGLFSFFSQPTAAADALPAVLPVSELREAKKVVTVIATAYSSTPDQTDDSPFITSNNLPVYDGLVAANWLSYGTQVKFPELYGDKIFTVNDRMHSRYGYGRVDIWLDAPRETVKEFGVKRLKMEIY